MKTFIIPAILAFGAISATQVEAQELPQMSNDSSSHWYYIQFASDNSVVHSLGAGQELRNRTAIEASPDQLWKLVGSPDNCIVSSQAGHAMVYDEATKRFKAAANPTDGTAMKLVANDSGLWELQIVDESIAPAATSVALVMNGGSGLDRYLDLWRHNFKACGLRFTEPDNMDFEFQNPPEAPAEVKISADGVAPAEKLALWYRTPAKNWVTQALPIGNGDMGAMIFGGIAQERIQFNHKTLWKGSAGKTDRGSYLAFGDVYLTERNPQAATGYVRALNLRRAEVTVDYVSQSTAFSRRYLASNPDGVIAVTYTADGPRTIDLDICMINAQGQRAAYTPSGASFAGTLANGMAYRASMSVVAEGGTVTASNSGIKVDGARRLTLYLACATNFDPAADSHLSGTDADLAASLAATLSRAVEAGFETVEANHLADYSALFNRVDFDLPQATNQYPTSTLLARTSNSGAMAMTDMLAFQYGRYLTIASSRGIAVPSNLQGIWCKDGNATSNAVWGSDIHANINVQMNYWPAEPTNLSECHMPFLDYIVNEATRPNGTWSANARDLGAQHGWVVNTAGNIFGGSSDYKLGKYSVANAWFCEHLWQHYAYTRDREFLLTKAMPVMKSACEFWFDRLVTAADGTLECPNEYSPEQGRVQNATAHAQQLVTSLFMNTLAAIDELGADSGCDEQWRAELADKLARLDKGMRIDSAGLLREWKYQENTPNQPADQNYFLNDEANVWQCHRHTSHLMGLYPCFTIDKGIDRDIFNAAVASLDDRGDVATGWARAWRISLWARARDAEHAYKTLRGFSHRTTALTYDWHGGLYDNMLDAHATTVFQIEGNFGATAGIAEMLLQSRPDSMVILPALPQAWASGSVRGLRAIGNFETDITWADGKLTDLKLRSVSGRDVTLAYPGIENATITTTSGNVPVADTSVSGRLSFATETGDEYTVTMPDDDSALQEISVSDSPVVITDGRVVHATAGGVSLFDTSGRSMPLDRRLPAGVYIVRCGASARVLFLR